MKAEITLEKGITSGKCYIFINDTFYVRISKKLFKELYDYLFNKEDNNEQNEMKEIEEIKAVIVRHHSGLGCDVLCDGDQCENCYLTAKDLYYEGYRKIAEDEIVVKKREYENKEIASFLRGRESAFCDIECMYNVQKKDIDYIKSIDKARQETARAILKELNDEGYKIYKQQGNTFDAGNFNWLIAYTMRKYGIELEDKNERL